MIPTTRRLLLKVAGASAVTWSAASAQSKLDKPVRIVVGYGAGTGLDTVTRYVAERLGSRLGQSVVVVNAPGADGNIGAVAAARAAPDMYNLLVAGSSTHAANAAIYPKLPFDPAADFAPLSAFGYIPFVLIVNPERSKARSFGEFIATARSAAAPLSFASTSVGSRIAGELFKQVATLKATNIPYKQSGEAMSDFLGGRLDYYFCDITTALPVIKSERAVALAISTKLRSPKLPQVPSLSELGFPDFDVSSWGAIWSASATTPRPVSDVIARHVTEILADEKGREFLIEKGYVPAPAGPKHLAELQIRDTAVFGKVIRDAGMAQQR